MNKYILTARIVIAIVFLGLVSTIIYVYNQSKLVKQQQAEIIKYKAEINNYINYYNAVEDLLDTIDNDINITDTYMCGDVGYNYYKSVIKITDCNRVKPSNYKPINKQCYGE